MGATWFAIVLVSSYLAGSVPFGLWIGLSRGTDLREHGSRNIGATNAGRVLGRRFGILVFLLDFAKGCGPVLLARAVARHLTEAEGAAVPEAVPGAAFLPFAAALAATLGHIFPIFVRFRGGKGVATSAGAFLALAPVPTLIGLLCWVVVLKVGRMVALASVVAAWVFLASCLVREGFATRDARVLAGLAAVVAVLITVRHRSNLARIARGEEPRIGRRPSDESPVRRS